MEKATVNQNCETVIILLGAPGSGKGTLSTLLSKRLQVPHISTGDLFRENIREETPLGKAAQTYIEQGSLVPDIVVLEMLFSRLQKPDCEKGVLLDGVPRTINQAEIICEKLSSNSLFHVFYLDVDTALLETRICGRLVCKDCSAPYHKTFNPPKSEVCDVCSGKLYQRSDDTPETFEKRLEIYTRETKPLIEVFKGKPEGLHTINGAQTKDKVLDDILDKLEINFAIS